ncbi:MAG TPA: AI-2E family transporter, partial [Myxococcota bacterium]|nr:AI-2E family transporter [Myxococcota bacterium]
MQTSKFTTWTFVLLLLLSTILVAHLLKGFLAPVVLALAIVSIFSPLHQRFLRAFNQHSYVAASVSTLLALLCLLIPLALFFVALVQQALLFYQATEDISKAGHISHWLATLQNWLEGLRLYLGRLGIKIAPNKIINVGLALFQELGQRIYRSIGLVAANLVSLAFNFVLTVALVFVLFVSGRATKNFLMELVPMPHEEKEMIVKRFQALSSAVFIGNGLISVLEGVIGGLLCYSFNISGALIWAVAISIAAFLPLVGASVVIIPISIYLFLNDQTWQAIVFLVLNGIQLLVLEMFVKPG